MLSHMRTHAGTPPDSPRACKCSKSLEIQTAPCLHLTAHMHKRRAPPRELKDVCGKKAGNANSHVPVGDCRQMFLSHQHAVTQSWAFSQTQKKLRDVSLGHQCKKVKACTYNTCDHCAHHAVTETGTETAFQAIGQCKE